MASQPLPGIQKVYVGRGSCSPCQGARTCAHVSVVLPFDEGMRRRLAMTRCYPIRSTLGPALRRWRGSRMEAGPPPAGPPSLSPPPPTTRSGSRPRTWTGTASWTSSPPRPRMDRWGGGLANDTHACPRVPVSRFVGPHTCSFPLPPPPRVGARCHPSQVFAAAGD